MHEMIKMETPGNLGGRRMLPTEHGIHSQTITPKYKLICIQMDWGIATAITNIQCSDLWHLPISGV